MCPIVMPSELGSLRLESLYSRGMESGQNTAPVNVVEFLRHTPARLAWKVLESDGIIKC